MRTPTVAARRHIGTISRTAKGSVQPVAPLVLDVARELDDQDRVFGGKSDQHPETYLREDVDVLMHDAHADGRSQKAHWHDQEHGKGQRP